jgi:hypothetical protein
VGRAAEMAELNELLRRARDGESCAAVVWGEAGIGKTRLVAEFCKSAVLGGATVLRAVSQPHDVRRPMGAFLDLTPRLLKLPGALGTSPEAMRYLQRLVTFDPQVDQPLTPEMRDPEYLAACITRALSELLDAVTAEGTLIVVMEDAQWLDRVSSMVLADLISERVQRRLLLLSTARASENPAPITLAAERTSSLRLRELGSDDARQLLSEHLRQLEVAPLPEVLDWAVRIALGNPFFLKELARHYAAHRAADRVPTSLGALLRARILGVSVDSQRILTACALLGKLATLKRVDALLGMTRPAFQLALGQLEEHGLLDGGSDELAFTHPTLGELALQRTTPGLRRLIARQAAELLECELPGASPNTILACADLWLQVGEPQRAAAALLQVARHAASLGQYQEALESLERFRQGPGQTSFSADLALLELALAEAVNNPLRVLELTRFLLDNSLGQSLTTAQREQIEARALLARWRTNVSAADLVGEADRLLGTVQDPAARIGLARIRLMLAAELFDDEGAHACYSSIVDTLADLTPADRDHAAIDLMYFATLRQQSEALLIARRTRERLRGVECRPENIDTAGRVAMAMSMLGDSDGAGELFSLLYESTSALNMHHTSFTLAAQHAAGLIIARELGAAKLWQNRAAMHACHIAPTPNLASFHITNAVLCAIDGEDALVYSHLREVQRVFAPDASCRTLRYAATIEHVLRSEGRLDHHPHIFCWQPEFMVDANRDPDISNLLELLATTGAKRP